MHVVYVTNKLVNGGGERVLVNLISAVRDRSGTASVLFLGRNTAIDPVIRNEVEAAGARVIRPSQIGALWAILSQATTIHLYNLNVYVKMLPFLPLLGKRRLICHVHGVAQSVNPLSRRLFCGLWNPCDEIVFVSETGKQSYGLSKGRVIRNPVTFPPRRKAVSQMPGGSLRILSVNRLVPVKRIEAQVDIVSLLVDRYSLNVHLDIVGEGEEMEALRERVDRKGVTGRVHFLGSMSHAEVIASYQQYDLFLTTSAAEGLGLSLVEALGAGLPAIASPIAAYKEVAAIGGGVLFLDPDNPTAAATKIHDAVEGNKFDCADLDALVDHFQPAAFRRQIFDIYQ